MLIAESNISTTARTLQGSTEGIPRVNPRTVRLARDDARSFAMPPPASRPATRKGAGGARNAARGAATSPKTQKARRGRSPRGPLSAHIEKRPPRARRPALPQPRAAVLSAKAGLTAGFGMGPGDPRLCGRARGGRSPAAQMYSSLPGPLSGATLAAAWRAREKIAHRARCFHRGCEELGLLVPLG